MADPRDVALLEARQLNPLNKGYPLIEPEISNDLLAARGWNLFDQDLPLPVAVIRESALDRNREWMRRVLARYNVDFAPHGKTTMSPELFGMQLADGAWGLTLSSPYQVRVARAAGVTRILLANEVVDPAFIRYIIAEFGNDEDLEFYSLVDSAEGVDILESVAVDQRFEGTFKVLIEVGAQGGRAGVRRIEDAIGLATRVKASTHVSLVGVEAFEGLIPGSSSTKTEPISAFLEFLGGVLDELSRRELFESTNPIISAGGSMYYDIVLDFLNGQKLRHPEVCAILRSGCYLTIDDGMYQQGTTALLERNEWAREIAQDVTPEAALRVFGYVQSIPEPGLAIVGIGRRDISSDDQRPKPVAWYRAGGGASYRTAHSFGQNDHVLSLNDQHAFLSYDPESHTLGVGDFVEMGVSHPCTTFDKWRLIFGIDDEGTVVGTYRTYF